MWVNEVTALNETSEARFGGVSLRMRSSYFESGRFNDSTAIYLHSHKKVRDIIMRTLFTIEIR